MKKWFVLLLLMLLGIGFTSMIKVFQEEEPVPIPPSPQRLGGNPQKGFEYLTTGDYLKSGIPYNLFLVGRGKDKNNYLNRQGLNKDLSHEYTVVKALNGENVVAPNCLQCHAQVFDGKLVMGLGNSFLDFTNNQRLNKQALEQLEGMLKANMPKQYEASSAFIQVTKTVGPLLTTQVRGVNPADRLAAVLAAHRDPITFKWNPEAQLKLPDEVIPTDVPAWWLLKKKNAMFYNGFGRGDFGKFLMASNLLTVNDTSESREVDRHMPDVLAYLRSLKAPAYPGKIDQALAKNGKEVFINRCSKCHGKYGDDEKYPNLLVPSSVVKTDSFLFKSNYSNPQFAEWFNRSWFTLGDHPARLVPFNGYIAPPLDGIWITAPFLHNGSVPTVEAVLNSKLRPAYWSRNYDSAQYDYEKLGWKYIKHDKPGGSSIYNTDLKGYGNYGHYFGDKLSDKDRRAVIEYLKTL